jgi:GTP-binding protein
MPGYGYAKVSKTQRSDWENLIRDYLRGRPTLRSVFVIVDSRHGLKESDEVIMTMLDEAAVSYRIILTKADKGGDIPQMKTVEAALKNHVAAFPVPYATSTHKGEGIAALRALIYKLSA